MKQKSDKEKKRQSDGGNKCTDFFTPFTKGVWGDLKSKFRRIKNSRSTIG